MFHLLASRHLYVNGLLAVLVAYLCQQCLADKSVLSLEEEEEEEISTSIWIYVCELLLVMILAWCFEQGQEIMKEKFAEMGRQGEQLIKMYDVMSNEIMILGFISLLVYGLTKTDLAVQLALTIYPDDIKRMISESDDPLAETFELIHMLIFAVMVCFILQCLILMYRGMYKSSMKWVIWENMRVGSFADFQRDEIVQLRVKDKWVAAVVEEGEDDKKPLKVRTLRDTSSVAAGTIVTSPIHTHIRKSKGHDHSDKDNPEPLSPTVMTAPPSGWARRVSKGNSEQRASAKERQIQPVSMAGLLQECGYADASGYQLQAVQPIINPWKRIFLEGKVIGVLQWRLLRHEFIFPHHKKHHGHHDELHSSSPSSLHHGGGHLHAETEETAEQWAPPDAHFFHFHEYLMLQLGEAFEELVEVDLITWGMTACLCCTFPLVKRLNAYWWTLLAAIISWSILVMMFLFGVHVYWICNELTVYHRHELPTPKELINNFKGTSATALKREHKKARVELQPMSGHDIRSSSAPVSRSLSEQPQQIAHSITEPVPVENGDRPMGASVTETSARVRRNPGKKKPTFQEDELAEEDEDEEHQIGGFGSSSDDEEEENEDQITEATPRSIEPTPRSIEPTPRSHGSSRIDDGLEIRDVDEAERLATLATTMGGLRPTREEQKAVQFDSPPTSPATGETLRESRGVRDSLQQGRRHMSGRFGASQGTSKTRRTGRSRPRYLELLSRITICGVKLLELPKGTAPDTHDTLFLFHEAGPKIYKHFVGDLLFLQSVMLALYMVLWFMLTVEWDVYQYAMYFFGLVAPAINLYWLAPKIVPKLCIITSIGCMKNRETAEKVIFDAKKNSLLESIKLMQMARLQGKIERITGADGKISKENWDKYANIFDNFSKKKQDDFQHMFDMFDEDNSGSIDQDEMKSIFKSIDRDLCESAAEIYKVIDADGSESIERQEFRVLMALVFYKGDDSSRREDIEALFEKFDNDGSGEITIKEMTAGFDQLGIELDDSNIAMLISQVFRQSKRKLNKEAFVEFVEALEEMADKS